MIRNLLIALVATLGLGIGVVQAGVCQQSVVWSEDYTEFTTLLVAGELTTIGVQGDGDTDLDLFVVDAFGTVIAAQYGSTDLEVVSFYPPLDGEYTIVVVNHGSVYNEFIICIE